MHTEHTERAVSPVVGVMLMLVVTIIIAAIVSAFAGGIWTAKEETLQVSLTARTPNSTTIYIDHMGGDGFNLDDVIVILDQDDTSLRFTNETLDSTSCYMGTKSGSGFVRPGDTIVLRGHDVTAGPTTFTATGSNPIGIVHNREFTWTILHSRTDAILSRGTLVFTE